MRSIESDLKEWNQHKKPLMLLTQANRYIAEKKIMQLFDTNATVNITMCCNLTALIPTQLM